METTSQATNEHPVVAPISHEFTPSQLEKLSRQPAATQRLIIKEISRIATERPESLPIFIAETLRFCLLTTPSSLTDDAKPEPAEVKDFWQVWHKLESAGLVVNHSASPALIAVSMTEFIQAAMRNNLGLFDRTVLAKYLPLSRNPKYLYSGRSTSSKHAGKTVRCWVFQRAQA